MKTQFIIISLLLLGFTARAQQPYLSREAYRDKVEAYSQILKQQKLKTMASASALAIVFSFCCFNIWLSARDCNNKN